MKSVILSLLGKENISSILKCNVISYHDLSLCEIKYVKDSKYYIASSFYTPVWIAATPAGPSNVQGEVIMNSIYDVAAIRIFDDPYAWRSAKSPKRDDLKKVYQTLTERAKEYFMNLLTESERSKVHSLAFSLTPLPAVMVSLVENGILLGSLAMTLKGEAYVILDTDSKVNSFVTVLNSRLFKQKNKEFCYVGLQS